MMKRMRKKKKEMSGKNRQSKTHSGIRRKEEYAKGRREKFKKNLSRGKN